MADLAQNSFQNIKYLALSPKTLGNGDRKFYFYSYALDYYRWPKTRGKILRLKRF